MALTPIDPQHALQIEAGIGGRRAGHKFEDTISDAVNLLKIGKVSSDINHNIFRGNPAELLVRYVANDQNIGTIKSVAAVSTGALATSEEGQKWLKINGQTIKRSKSDLVLTIEDSKSEVSSFGVSTKQCNNKNPTNAQVYFTTAVGFVSLLDRGGIDVSDNGLLALRQFCGDASFRPSDCDKTMKGRQSDPRRYFWEEINADGRAEIEIILGEKQDEVTRLLLQHAYAEDHLIPEYILHKTKRCEKFDNTEVAIYSIDELIALSRSYQGFATKEYSVRKGSYKDPPGVRHLAPRFGVIQMQRGGQKQHPTQLQFNLEASYFYKLRDTVPQANASHDLQDLPLRAAEQRSRYRFE